MFVPKVHSCCNSIGLSCGNTCCLLSYPTDSGFTKLIEGILSAASAAAWRDFHFSFLDTQYLKLRLGFGSTPAYVPLSCVCSPPRWKGTKQQLIGECTHSAGEGYDSHTWDVCKVPVAIAIDWGTLGLVGILPSGCGGRGWCVGVVVAPTSCELLNKISCFLGRPQSHYGQSCPWYTSLLSPLLYPCSQQHSFRLTHSPNLTL